MRSLTLDFIAEVRLTRLQVVHKISIISHIQLSWFRSFNANKINKMPNSLVQSQISPQITTPYTLHPGCRAPHQPPDGSLRRLHPHNSLEKDPVSGRLIPKAPDAAVQAVLCPPPPTPRSLAMSSGTYLLNSLSCSFFFGSGV